MNVYRIKSTTDINIFGELSVYPTDDGSISIHSSRFREGFHCSSGALKEAQKKFLKPAQLDRFSNSTCIHVLDVCMGMGYNSACIFEELIKNSIRFQWWGLEIDNRPMSIGINNPIFKSLWSQEVQEILMALKNTGYWTNNKSRGKILWGDARHKLTSIPKRFSFDLILHDAFSPNKNPMLWSEEFLFLLAQKLTPDGRLITYCSAAAIRASLRRAGLELASQVPLTNEKRKWSNGTIAVSNTKELTQKAQESIWQPLSQREEEHLLTKAAVPYRDPTGTNSDSEILLRREEEQKNSDLEVTSNWKQRWAKAQ
ncbi:MnmC family methyltransferase [Prochlorococcus sp. MIT 1307]|uniref:MnmC family methyltransferase n=1 Tax=Prochlorococcus sp. MIT 1307 TaxID=3096219 RepID=UPI002A750F70|nr:MnmC family methyltransferase [Prochlorococcus sp. MIT 1307]